MIYFIVKSLKFKLKTDENNLIEQNKLRFIHPFGQNIHI